MQCQELRPDRWTYSSHLHQASLRFPEEATVHDSAGHKAQRTTAKRFLLKIMHLPHTATQGWHLTVQLKPTAQRSHWLPCVSRTGISMD